MIQASVNTITVEQARAEPPLTLATARLYAPAGAAIAVPAARLIAGELCLERHCRKCGQPFVVPVRRTKNGRGWFCSGECARLARRRTGGTPKQQHKRAHRIVERALANGSLKRGPCEVCGSLNSHAHHRDYSKPLEVTWLCRLDHNRIHHLGRKRSPETRRKIRAAALRKRIERVQLNRMEGVQNGL
ncbi:MAG: hypothetical protein IMZ50_06125 [Candidatus Atribacteria bacterium]|nr:hypothetical protein [Candidatus Atribacteria bacterium]